MARRRMQLSTGSAGIGLALGLPGLAWGATFSVTNLDDAGPGSLRQALLDANAAVGPDLVTFGAGLSGTLLLTSGELAIIDSVTIEGPGASALTLSGNDASRIFYVDAPADQVIAVTISGLRLTAATGSAIRAYDANLVVRDSEISGNTVSGWGGALYANGPSLLIERSVLSGNTASASGGAIWAGYESVVIRDTVFSGNTNTGGGGAVNLWADSIRLERVTVTGNSAGLSGGGLYLRPARKANPPAVGEIAIEDTIVSGNDSARAGGGVSLVGPATATIRRSSILENQAGEAAGGLASSGVGLEITDSRISGNTSTLSAGGLYHRDAGLTLRRSIVSGNTAGNGAGGAMLLEAYDAALPALGKGVLIADSSFVGNRALSGSGGGVLLDNDSGTVFSQVTVSENSCNAGSGGGINAQNSDNVSITHSTIASNVANIIGGGLALNAPSQTTLRNSIVAENAADGGAPDISGALGAEYSLIGDTTDILTLTDLGGGNIIDVAAALEPLTPASNGQLTHVPAPESPAINAGDPAFAPPPSTDQRGLPRVVGGRIDMGAAERQVVEILFRDGFETPPSQ